MKQKKSILATIILAVVVFLAGLASGMFLPAGETTHADGSHSPEKNEEIWTCSMHPSVRQPEPGKCPICSMDLIKVDLSEEQTGGGQNRLALSPSAIALAEVQTEKAIRRETHASLRLYGKVQADPRREMELSLLTRGRVVRLYADYIGMPLRKGDHVAEIYSPEVVTAIRELKNAVQSGSRSLIQSSKERLVYLGVSQKQVNRLEQGDSFENYQVNSPMDGYLIELNSREGSWLNAGLSLGVVSDLSRVWIVFDVFENDLSKLKRGQKIECVFQGLPGKVYEGILSRIDPVLNEKTRSVKARVELNNPDNLLKPGMLAEGSLRVRLDSKGETVAPRLSSLYSCPMHPGQIRQKEGECEFCGMPLEPESQSSDDGVQDPLTIPKSAVLYTGRRSLVYVRMPGDTPKFEGREILLGPDAEESAVVLEGISEGEQVVVEGNFMIDSELQIRGKQSMMSHAPEENQVNEEENDGAQVDSAFSKSLKPLAKSALLFNDKLSSDSTEGVEDVLNSMLKDLETADYSALNTEQAAEWFDAYERLEKRINQVKARVPEGLSAIRDNYQELSEELIRVFRRFGSGTQLHVVYCSMKDASWVQGDTEVANPFYGESMLRCGEVKETIGTP